MLLQRANLCSNLLAATLAVDPMSLSSSISKEDLIPLSDQGHFAADAQGQDSEL